MTYERLGVNALDKKEWAAAAAYFRKGVELAPDNPSLRPPAGDGVVPERRCATAAMEQFEEVVRRSPDFAKARYSLGVLLIDERPGGRSDRTAVGRGAERPELHRGAPAAGRGSAAQRTAGGVAVAVRAR